MSKHEAAVATLVVVAVAGLLAFAGSCGIDQLRHQAKFEDQCAQVRGTTVKLNGYLSCNAVGVNR